MKDRVGEYLNLRSQISKMKGSCMTTSKSELNCGIIDEFIVQHDRLKELYEGSVNTIRVVTIIENSKCNILLHQYV